MRHWLINTAAISAVLALALANVSSIPIGAFSMSTGTQNNPYQNAVSASPGKIAFTSYRNGRYPEIYVMNGDGTNQAELLSGIDYGVTE